MAAAVQRHVLCLGEINSFLQAAWRKTIEVFETGSTQARTVALFPEERSPAVDDDHIVRICLDQLELRRPRQWGACWLADVLYQKLELDHFWSERLQTSRKGTRWDHVLQTLVSYRLINPGSEWRLHRQWFDRSAMADLLGADYRLAADDTLYRCLDQLTGHKATLFSHLQERWRDLFNARFDVLLYDLTSTYFESDPPFAKGDKRRFGCSRDQRFDCVQVVIALVVTPEGFPLGYDVLPDNTLDKQTLQAALESLEKQSGNRSAAREAFRRIGEVAGDAMAQMLTLVDGLAVIGGGISGAAPLFMPALVRELKGTYTTPDGHKLRRLIPHVYNLNDTKERQRFVRGKVRKLLIPGTRNTLTYDSEVRIGVGLSRLGTSHAIATGACAFALAALGRRD